MIESNELPLAPASPDIEVTAVNDAESRSREYASERKAMLAEIEAGWKITFKDKDGNTQSGTFLDKDADAMMIGVKTDYENLSFSFDKVIDAYKPKEHKE